MNREVRPYHDGDEEQVLSLLSSSLGWMPDDHHARFFRWKHLQNPAGRSAMWVATRAGEILGFRALMRWQFLINGQPVKAVRAVDTATHPSARGEGIFRELTMHALDELRAGGVGFVFNTPNDQSRPGYLKMGWIELGRPRVGFLPSGPRSISRMLRSRVPAEKWSISTGAGLSVPGALNDAKDEAMSRSGAGVVTNKTREHLLWRYAGMPELHYRGLPDEGGVLIFRLRKRGHAVEAAVCEVLAPDLSAHRRLVRQLAKSSLADYVLFLEPGRKKRSGFPLPGAGPIVTWRHLQVEMPPPMSAWHLSLGDVELF